MYELDPPRPIQTAPSPDALAAVQLLAQMDKDPSLYLTPLSRDHFYLTTY